MSHDAQQHFVREGFVPCVRIMSEAQMARYRAHFDDLEAASGKEAAGTGLLNLHTTDALVWELVSHARVIDAMREVLGPDLLLLGSHFFVKYPEQKTGYVAWHQDVTYWGLEPAKAATLWLAIDDADVENGCMRMIRGSHRRGILPHGTADRGGNMLSVNQEIAADLIDEALAVDTPLPAGCASIHDGLTIHGSNPNLSSRRRCGLTIRFTTPDVRPAGGGQVAAQKNPILVSGEDRYGHFDLAPPPGFASTATKVFS